MEELRKLFLWAWDKIRRYRAAVGTVAFSAVLGGLLMWFYSIRKARAEALRAERQLRDDRKTGAIDEMLRKIEVLDSKTPGGLRSRPLAEEGENQEIVNVAWERFVEKRRGSSKPSRF
jgi:hypothetical protein